MLQTPGDCGGSGNMRMAAVCAPAICFKRSIAVKARRLHVCNTGRSANHTITLQNKQRIAQHWKRWDLLTRHQRALSCRLQRPHDYTRCLNGTSCSFDFMACSVCLEVMPHSATSSVSGDDTSTIVTWNSGVNKVHQKMSVNTL